MDSRGFIKKFKTMADAIKEGFKIPVNKSELTLNRLERLESQIQPVVLPNDNKSVLGKKRVKHNRNRNKAAKKSRQKNR